jgi:hypothetical protein
VDDVAVAGKMGRFIRCWALGGERQTSGLLIAERVKLYSGYEDGKFVLGAVEERLV